MQKDHTPFLWYSKEAEEAAAFYASIFPDSRVNAGHVAAERIAQRPAGVSEGRRFSFSSASLSSP
jgi:predicted 3-demethylubiquinone-9 3-methyltransferase (glyoxalase superfamily)